MPARQSNTPHLDRKINTGSRAPLSSASRPKARSATSVLGAAFVVTRDSLRDDDAAGPSRPRASTSKAPLHDRKHPLSKQQSSSVKSRIPTSLRAPTSKSIDVKGKGREVVIEEPRKSPTRKATHQNYALNESASSEDDEEMYMPPKQSTSSHITLDDVPVQTPRNARGSTPKRRVASSSAVRQGSARARTASLAPSEVWSAMKPIPLKTVYLSSPPRPGRSSDTESPSESDDEVRLIEPPTTSARKRKAAAGEYTWDERSRSCIPKRERSRSRSLTASAHRKRYGSSTPGDHGDDSIASDRSHLQDRVFPTSDNDLLRSLLTNRFRAKARNEQATPAKREQVEDHGDPFLDTPDDTGQAAPDDTDMYLDLPAMQEDNLAAEQPIFDFSYSGLPDDDSDDDDDITGGRAAFSSSDDGFERSIIHFDDSLHEEADLPEFAIGAESHQSQGIKSEVPEKDVIAPDSTRSSDATEVLPEDIADTSVAKEPENWVDIIVDDVLANLDPAHPMSVQVAVGQNDDIRSTRSSSAVSDLPPSSPPPLPSYQSESAISDGEDGVPEAVADTIIPFINIDKPSNLSAGPLSPKTTNRLARPFVTARSPSPKVVPKRLHSTLATRVENNNRRSATPDTLFLVQEHLANSPDGVAPSRQTQEKTSPSILHTANEAALLANTQPAASKQPSPNPSPQLSNDQLFFRLTSPRLPQMTPVRIRRASPAAFAVYSMTETGATPTLARHYDTRGKSAPLTRSHDHQEQDVARVGKIETLSPLQPSTATFGTPRSPRFSPHPVTTLSFPPLSAKARRASRSPTLLNATIAASQQSLSIPQEPALRPAPVEAASPAGRLETPIPQPTALLAPPSPFLQRTSRSPTPDQQAEQAAASLLDRVRALRSPNIARILKLTTVQEAGEQTERTLELDGEQPIEEQAVVANSKKNDASFELEHSVLAALDDMDGSRETSMDCDQAARPRPADASLAIITEEELAQEGHASNSEPNSRLDGDMDEISSTGLTDARSDSDSEGENMDVGVPLRPARTPSKSPAINRVMLPLHDSPLSPNVTVRRDRSVSRSTASTRSIKSTRSSKLPAKSPTSRSRRMSFADIGSLHSSPLSVAASIGRASFDALDSSSDEEEESESGKLVMRPSPSKAIAAQQLRYGHMQEDQSGSSDEEALDLSSSPTRSVATELVHASPKSTVAPLNTSTPARMMHTLELQSSETFAQLLPVIVSTPNPRRQLVASPKPAASPYQIREGIPTTASAAGNRHIFLAPPVDPTRDREDTDLEPKLESSQDSQFLEGRPDDSYAHTALSADTSAALDEARPRTSLMFPPLANIARPSPARSKRSSHAHPTPSILMTTPDVSIAGASETARVDSVEALSRGSRSRSVVSRQESVTSQASTMVQVSSADPVAAARAAAILKVHHHYVQEGTWPAGVNPMARAASGSSEEGERALDDLLKQAEREVSTSVQETSQSSRRAPVDSSQDELSVNVTMASHDDSRRERSISASRHVLDQSKLDVWTRHDWRALEQCFIDELRRKRSSREQVEPAEVVRLYLESEQLRPEHCVGQRRPELLEIRVEALIARKQQKGPRVNRDRSHSVVSTAYSRAPSDFFVDEDVHMHTQKSNESFADTTYLDIPGALLSPGRRRYARSAEPVRVETARGQQNYARHRGISTFQSLQRRLPTHTSLSRETSLSSVAEAEEAQSIASEPSFSCVSRRLSRLYPSLEDLKAEMKPKTLLPVRGRSVAAAVNLFERIEEEQSMEAQWEQTWLKRKASEQDLHTVEDTNKKVRL